MRILGAPLKGDDRVISGPSGAVCLGALYELMNAGDQEIAAYRKEMRLDEQSVVLVFSTEGDTNPDLYRKIVWDGEFYRN